MERGGQSGKTALSASQGVIAELFFRYMPVAAPKLLNSGRRVPQTKEPASQGEIAELFFRYMPVGAPKLLNSGRRVPQTKEPASYDGLAPTSELLQSEKLAL